MTPGLRFIETTNPGSTWKPKSMVYTMKLRCSSLVDISFRSDGPGYLMETILRAALNCRSVPVQAAGMGDLNVYASRIQVAL